MSGTFMSPIPPLSLPSAHHKHYQARSSTHNSHVSATPFVGITDNSRVTSLAHDLLAKHSATKWLEKHRKQYELNREMRKAKHEAAHAAEVDVSIPERQASDVSDASRRTATEEGKMTAAFAG